jgi:hypothetical protein
MFLIFWKKKIGKKAAHNLLVNLTKENHKKDKKERSLNVANALLFQGKKKS